MSQRVHASVFAMVASLGACAFSTAPGADARTGSVASDASDGPPSGHPVVASSTQLCKLLSNRNVADPTANDVQHRGNVLGADLGIPVVHADTLYLLFGDTIGFAGIWSPQESHPDSVGYGLAPASTLAGSPELLCDQLRVLVLAPDHSIGPTVDPSVVADFAGAAMSLPSGSTSSIGTFIRNPAGSPGSLFPNLPGDFEVPSGAFDAGDSIYVFYTTVVSSTSPEMKASYLARWRQPSPDASPFYEILYLVDERFDSAGPLHGRFVNIAAEVDGDYVYLFGTGAYRQSGIAIVRKRLDALATPGGFEEIGDVTSTPGYGEVSVRYFPSLRRWMVLAEELLPGSNRIVAYFATSPEGPWGTPMVVHDMADPAFHATYCCAVDDACDGAQMFNCDRTGFYGSYLLPGIAPSPDGFTVTYTLSSFSPYNVALFQTRFTIQGD